MCMSREILDDVLNLKEGNGYFIMSINYKKDLEKGNYSLVIDADSNFIAPLLDESNFSKLFAANLSLKHIYQKYIESDLIKHNVDEIPVSIWHVIADEEGPCIGVHIPYGGEVISNEMDGLLDQALKSIREIQNDMTDKLDLLLNKFIDEKETKNMRRYQLIFSRDFNGNFRTSYNSFIIRETDDNSEVKYLLRNLLTDDFIEKLFAKFKEEKFDVKSFEDDMFVADFFTDGEDVYDLIVKFPSKKDSNKE